jgi:3-oxoacyl-[acyl-carrier protein] reductase
VSVPSRSVLITGASRGIGRAIALELAQAGFELALNGRTDSPALHAVEDEVARAGVRTWRLAFDVSDPSATRAALEAHLAAHGAFWGVVINAGISADNLFASMKPAEWQRVLRTNLDGFFHVVQPLVMPMVRLRAGGRIVAVASVSGVTGNAGQANYAASKAGLIAAARSLALELAKREITVNSIAPGYIETDMTAELARESIVATIPLRRMGCPEEVARLVGFLFEQRAAYITGQCLAIDGGLT